MPDVANGTNTSLPAQAASCLPCPVRCMVQKMFCALRHLIGRAAVLRHDTLFVPQANYYQPLTGKAKCIACPAGTSTMDDGNTECQACPVGYFSPTAGEGL